MRDTEQSFNERLEDMSFNDRIKKMNRSINSINNLSLPECMKETLINNMIRAYIFLEVNDYIGRKCDDYIGKLNSYANM